MRTLILVISFFFALAVSAQEQAAPIQHSIKLYNLSTWEPDQVDRPYANPAHQRETDRLRALHPTIAYHWRSDNGSAQEIELMNLSLQSTNTYTYVVNDNTGAVQQVLQGGRTVETHIAVRYEYMRHFNRSGVSRWTPSIGIAVAPYFRQYREMPLISVGYPANEQRYGAMLFTVPRITYRISSRFHVDLNVPVCISDGYFMREDQFDPNPLAGQKITSFNFQGLPALYSLRAGIGVML